MSSRKSKRGQKLGSSRRNKNRNQETEEKDNDDGYQDPGKEEPESECQFLTVSENQSSNESSLLHPDHPVVVCTSPSSSVLEFSPQPQSKEFNVVLGQADITSKKRKMGSTRKGNRNFKFEEISEDEPEHRVQLTECTSENEGNSKNAEYQNLEAALQSKHMDISSSEPNQLHEAEFSQVLMHDQSNLNCIINDTLEVTEVQSASLIYEHEHMTEFSQDLKHDRSSLNVMVKDTLEGSHAENIIQDEVTGVQSASLIYEHEHMTEDDKMSTVIWENVNSKASTEDEKTVEHCLEHKDTSLQLTEETIYKSESTEVREDTDEYKEVSDPISHQVSEARPGTEEVTKVKDTNISPEAGLVSLDSNRKTSPSVVSTGIRQKIDFEQWNEQIPDFGQLVYNIVMVGNSSVGKTSFIKRLQSGHFIPDYSSTIGVDTFVHTVTLGSKTVKLYVWDTAGQERYHSITRQVFHKAQGLLLMYDITSSQSFHAVRAWISQIQENAHPDVILMLLGNKNDCADREVQLQEGETLSKEYDIHFMECSVATGENVSESLKTLAWLLMKQRVRKEEEHKTLQPKPQQNKKSGCC
ncbi:ras and EF-hand domain-containing protein isoform X3 [Tachysurus fulvidraco]|uniref:ras and EF-hand domain-containing protein isoform X3 n=1 Tax=Tachysurus fulvidraco TaxID=1234273 RepID=UPI001FEFAF3B|nr:ras and EF-hand domain-containing protein isoform X3 [Tachysurus fulvidraco]